MNLDQTFEHYLPHIDADLKDLFQLPLSQLSPFYGMMSYHMGWTDETFSPIPTKTGKRLRPIVCLLACGAAGGEPTCALPAASALELVHNFSLVHDDIQDNSPTRRHRKTVWTIWGAPHAINVGDGLFALAFLSLSRLQRTLAADRLSAIDEAFAQACLLLCEGQYMDMSFEAKRTVREDEYLQMIGRKTGALISCAAHIGAMVATNDAHIGTVYQRFGQLLGLAFQVQDDILGIWGDPAITGKPIADDIRQCKKTLPLLYAIQREAELGQHWLADLLAVGTVSHDDIPHILEVLDTLGALNYARTVNATYCDQALEALQTLEGMEPYQSVLVELVDRLRDRPA